MAPQSSTLAWKNPMEPGGLQSMGSLKVKHDWATSLSLFTCMHWRRKWQPTLVFLPGESEDSGAWGRTEWLSNGPVRWPPHPKSWLIGKYSDAGRDWGQEEKGTTEDEMTRWHHRLNGHEFEWTLGVGDGQGGVACCSSWGCKELDMTEQLDWTELNLNKVPAG